MENSGQGFPKHLLSAAGKMGSMRAHLDLLNMTNPDKVLMTLREVDVKNFWTEERQWTYDLIDRSIDDGDERDQANIYVSTEGLKWISEKQFNKYPYGPETLPQGVRHEIHERISKAFDVLGCVSEEPISNPDTLSLSLSLAEELQSALNEYEEWSKDNPKLDFGQNIEAMRARTAVYTLTYLDTIKDMQPDEAGNILGDRSLVNTYIKQFEYLLGPEKDNPLFEVYGYKVFEELVSHVSPEDETAIEDLIWLFNNSDHLNAKDSLRQDALRKDALDRAMFCLDTYADQAKSEMDIKGLKALRTKKEAYSRYKSAFTNIAKNLEDNLAYIILSNPSHVKGVVAQYPENRQYNVWQNIGGRVVDQCDDMSKSVKGLTAMSNLQYSFGALCPYPDIIDQVDQEVLDIFAG